MITQHYKLNEQQLADLDSLCAECKMSDGNIVALYKHILSQQRTIPCTLLYYQGNRLIGFLSSFFFYEKACEVSMMIAPDFRKQGIATQLINTMIPIAQTQQMEKLLFSTPNNPSAENGNEHWHWLSDWGFSYESSEYQMRREKKDYLYIRSDDIIMRPATLDDIPVMCTMDSACFAVPQPNRIVRFHQVLCDPSYQIVMAQKEGEPIGKAHVFKQPDGVRLTDIAVLPNHQGHGYGSAMIAFCINQCIAANQSTIILDVEAINHQALKLYTQLGFIIVNAYSFWTTSLDELKMKYSHNTSS